jgi:2-phospho-L-lactate guanylyltransferase (CobY/MobA/RfbA family)
MPPELMGVVVRSERVSPRQGVVVLPLPASDLAGSGLAAEFDPTRLRSIVLAVLFDVLGALVRVDGVTLAVIVPPDESGRALLAKLPAGIEVIAVGRTAAATAQPERLLTAAFGALLDRDFDRVAGVAGDVLRLTPRIVATALSSLGSADLVVGPTRRDRGYLVGVRDRRGLGALGAESGGPFGGARLLDAARGRGLVARRLEPLPRLAELEGRAALESAVAHNPAALPRLMEQLGQPD